MSVEQRNKELSRLKAEQARLEKLKSAAETASSKARADANAKAAKAAKATGSTSASYAKQAEAAEKKMNAERKKAADLCKKLADNSSKQTAAIGRLNAATKAAQRKDDLEASRRRAAEKAHARDIARASRPTVITEVRIVTPPKPEELRVLYLAANPHGDLRVEVEVRTVRQAVRQALHRDQVAIDHRPAATPEDLLEGMNDVRPHVVHFAGHGGGQGVLFDDAMIRDEPDPEDDHDEVGRPVDFGLLARALAATDHPPTLLVLNACDTLDGAETLLDAVPVVIAMASSVTDLAATVFAARFYAAVASGQSVQAALDQAAVAVDLAGLDAGWIPTTLARADVTLADLVLVQPPAA